VKLATLQTPMGPQLAALRADGATFVLLEALNRVHNVLDPTALGSMLSLIEAGSGVLDGVRDLVRRDESERVETATVALANARLLAPLPRPPRLRCFSVYEVHMRQAVEQVVRHRAGGAVSWLAKTTGMLKPPSRWYRVPAYYKGNHLSVAGPDHAVARPGYTRWLDYELELGVVLGKAGRDIERGDAMKHVFGYTIFNDLSARDVLIEEMVGRPGMGPAKGKDFNDGNVLGPWIVTADELVDPYALQMQVRVNGELRGSGRSGEMHHRIDAMIAYASQSEDLVAGEVFGCGAVGNGTGIESWRFLEDGDVVELTIEGIGTLRNRVTKPNES
jgi:2-keto-4-pentenoate hydratase/2-oxohepta-3-ene-1,7-dioic acid hydratase in catechol pathway